MSNQQGITPEFALGYCAMTLDGILREAEITKKVIAAVPDAASSYRPDPKARTAKELAWHIANSDIQFLDGIADLKFNMETPEHKPQPSQLSRRRPRTGAAHDRRGISAGSGP